jgi:cellulose biosynthesis protein BcsQ
MNRLGDLAAPHVECVDRDMFTELSLVPGDLGLSLFEDRLSEAWPRCQSDNQAEAADAFRVMSAFYRIMARAAAAVSADLVLIDVGRNLGAINRAALVASDFVVVPLGADLFSLQGLRDLAPTLAGWRRAWRERLDNEVRLPDLTVPSGDMRPIGYVIVQPVMRQDRRAKAHGLWIDRVHEEYCQQILARPDRETTARAPHMLASIRHYLSLMPLAQEARKPMFALKPADGAIGSHAAAVQDCRRDFQDLALRIASALGVDLSTVSVRERP